MFDRPLTTRRPSAEEILAELTLGSTDFGAATTLAEWDGECEITPDVPETVLGASFEDLRRVLERWFGISISKVEAKHVLSPMKARTLGELAAFIAERAVVATPGPAQLGGKASAAAGLFIAFRHALARRGVAANRIRPSTRLAGLLAKHPQALSATFRELAPAHSVDAILRRPRLHFALSTLGIVGVLTAIVGGFVSDAAPILGTAVALIGLIGALIVSGRVVAHDESRYDTVADWCRAAAGERTRNIGDAPEGQRR